MQIQINVDFQKVVDGLQGAALRQVPFIAKETLNSVAKDVRKRIQDQLPVKFDRPTPFTQRGVFMEFATKQKLEAAVFIPKSQADRGKADREYMRPGAEGAIARRQKKTEFVLSKMGVLPSGWVTVPGSFFKDGNKFDQYGNISGAYYKAIIRGLGLSTAVKPRALSARAQKRIAGWGVQTEYFAVTTGTNKLGKNGGYLPSGVYRRSGPGGRKLLQYLLFVKKASYKQRINFRDEAQTVLAKSAQAGFSAAVSKVQSQFLAG